MNALKQTVRTIPLDQIEGILKAMQVTDIIDAIQDIQICKLVSRSIQLKTMTA